MTRHGRSQGREVDSKAGAADAIVAILVSLGYVLFGIAGPLVL
jgi:hypothetical protein